jgi:CBS domain-containing protein
MVRRVKRTESFVVENPVTIGPQASFKDARKLMADSYIGGLVVVDEDGTTTGHAHGARYPAGSGYQPASKGPDDPSGEAGNGSLWMKGWIRPA